MNNKNPGHIPDDMPLDGLCRIILRNVQARYTKATADVTKAFKTLNEVKANASLLSSGHEQTLDTAMSHLQDAAKAITELRIEEERNEEPEEDIQGDPFKTTSDWRPSNGNTI